MKKHFYLFFLTIDWKKILIGKKIIAVLVFCVRLFQVKVYKFCKKANTFAVFHLECINCFFFVLGSLKKVLYRFYLGCMNFSFTRLQKRFLKITNCASGDARFENINNEDYSCFEPSWICNALVVSEVFFLGTSDSSF
jgi:hypothetical protein